MTTVLIVVLIVFCVGLVVAIVGHRGTAIRIRSDRGWRGQDRAPQRPPSRTAGRPTS